MSKDNRYYLDKMQKNISFILEHMEGVSQEQLEGDPVLLDSMMLRLVQISEDARNLSEEFKEKNSQIPWTDIYGLRNRIVHDYGNVDLEIIYDTLTNDVPEVQTFIENPVYTVD